MATVREVGGRRRRTGRLEGVQRLLPVAYVLIAIGVAAVFLPSILRPPPEQTSDTAALNPNAPPDDQSESVIQANQQAKGSGAGVVQGTGGPGGVGQAPPTTTTSSTAPPPLAHAQCFGSPPRQAESIYAAPCAPAFNGDNGGATAKNVFPNEVRISLWHGLTAPTPGRINPNPHPGESAVDRTFRVLEVYFNQHYQTWGRHVSFYGGQETATGETNTPEAQAAEAQNELDQWKIFAAWHLDKAFCETIAKVGPVICNPFEHDEFVRHRPNLYSFMMDIDQSNGFDAEFACKKLLGKPASFAGVGVDKASIRKFGLVAENTTTSVAQTTGAFNRAFQKECGATVKDAYEVDFNDQQSVQNAVAQMYANHVTTVMLDVLGGTAVEMMSAADALGWQPEWMVMGNYGLDLNNFALTFPRSQSQHVFGINTWELPQRQDEWECSIAYRSVDPSNSADADTCRLNWHPIVVLMNMIQEAGPHLTPQSVQDGMFRVGRRFPATPQWRIGGGFGPDDYSYMDDVGVVWYSNTRINPENGAPGAYVWTQHGHRFQRGEMTSDTSELFQSGVTAPGQPDTAGGGPSS